jgi:hypothetical protein
LAILISYGAYVQNAENTIRGLENQLSMSGDRIEELLSELERENGRPM